LGGATAVPAALDATGAHERDSKGWPRGLPIASRFGKALKRASLDAARSRADGAASAPADSCVSGARSSPAAPAKRTAPATAKPMMRFLSMSPAASKSHSGAHVHHPPSRAHERSE